jgi:hypothetical protein
MYCTIHAVTWKQYGVWYARPKHLPRFAMEKKGSKNTQHGDSLGITNSTAAEADRCLFKLPRTGGFAGASPYLPWPSKSLQVSRP